MAFSKNEVGNISHWQKGVKKEAYKSGMQPLVTYFGFKLSLKDVLVHLKKNSFFANLLCTDTLWNMSLKSSKESFDNLKCHQEICERLQGRNWMCSPE